MTETETETETETDFDLMYATCAVSTVEGYFPYACKLFMELHEYNSQFDSSLKVPKDFELRIEEKFGRANRGSGPEESWLLLFCGVEPAGLGILSIHDNFFAQYAEIEAVYVRKGYRRMGAGRAIVEELRNCAALNYGIEDVRLYVSAKNVDALQFYISMGFDILQHVLKSRRIT